MNDGEGDTDAVAQALAEETRTAKARLPGFGHPHLKPVDPRSERLFNLADERGVSGPHVAMARALSKAADEVWGAETWS